MQTYTRTYGRIYIKMLNADTTSNKIMDLKHD